MPQILIDFVPDYSKVQTAADELGVSISSSIKEGTQSGEKALDNLAGSLKGVGSAMANGLKDGLGDSLREIASVVQKSSAQNIAAINAEWKKAASSGDIVKIKKQIEDFKKASNMTTVIQEQAAYKRAIEGLEKGLVRFEKTSKKTENSQLTLRQQLRQVRNEIEALRDAGDTGSEKLRALEMEAGRIKKTMNAAALQVKNFASEARTVEQVTAAVSGVAAAFSVAQGVTALFGNQNKEFERTLQKVMSAMAILNGIERISLLLKQESAAMQGVLRVRKLAEAAATKLQTAAQSENIIVTKAATITMRALNAVMKANPVFLLITAFTALASVFSFFSSKTSDTEEKEDKLNETLERQNRILEKQREEVEELEKAYQRAVTLAVLRAKIRGASEAEIAKIQSDYRNKEIEDIEKQNRKIVESISTGFPVLTLNIEEQAKSIKSAKEIRETILDLQGFSNTEEKKRQLDEYKNMTDQWISNLEKIEDLRFQNEEQRLNRLAQHRNDALRDEIAAIKQKLLYVKQGTQEELDLKIELLNQEKELRKRDGNLTLKERQLLDEETKKAIENEKANFKKRQIQDAKDEIESKLLLAKEGSAEEFELRRQLVDKQLEYDLAQEGLHQEQIDKLKANAAKQRSDIDKAETIQKLENKKSLLNAELADINKTAEERLKISLDVLNTEEEEEIAKANDNQDKITEIRATYERKRKDLSLKTHQEILDEELARQRKHDERILRGLEKSIQKQEEIINNSSRSYRDRFKAVEEWYKKEQELIEETKNRELEAIKKRIEETERALKAGEISQEEAKKKLDDLKSDEKEITQNAEDKKTEITKSSVKKRGDLLKEEINAILQFVSTITSSIEGIMNGINEAQLQAIEQRKKALDQEKEAGAITEKAYKERQKRLEIEEKAIKTRQAKREKAMAIFQALIAAARAVVEALPDPFKVATVIAISSAQIAAIIAKPIPKFGKGTKSAPKGFAVVGETGAEIIKRNDGSYEIAGHEKIVWMKGGERIYNPTETAAIFNQRTPTANAEFSKFGTNASVEIDYDKLAKGIGSEISKYPRLTITLDEKGFTKYTEQERLKTIYRNKRYRFDE